MSVWDRRVVYQGEKELTLFQALMVALFLCDATRASLAS